MSMGQLSCLLEAKDSPTKCRFQLASWKDGRGTGLLGNTGGSLPNSPAPHNPSVNNADSHIWQIKQNQRYAKEASPWSTTSCEWLWRGDSWSPKRR